MARSYAPLLTSIWADRLFTALPADAQRVYLLAMSQPNVSYAGVVPFTEKRWASLAPDTTPGYIADAVNVLEDRGYVLLDDETEELWVRSFVKHNRIVEQPQLKKSLLRAVDDILSATIRTAVVASLPASLKEQVGSPVAACPPPSLSASGSGQGLDLDPDQYRNRESEPAADPVPVVSLDAPSTALSLLAAGKRGSHGVEVESHVAALLAVHGFDAVDRAVATVAERLNGKPFAWPSDVRKALEAELGPADAAKPHPLDDAQRAQLAEAEKGLDHVRAVTAQTEPDPEARKAFLAEQRARRTA